MFAKKEVSELVIAILILGLVFGFNDRLPAFELNHWLLNLFHMIILVAVSLTIHIFAQKIVASGVNAKVRFTIWKTKNITPSLFLPFHFPIGVFLAFIISILSNGLWYFTGIFESVVTEKTSRVTRKFPKVLEFEEAKILLAGPLANLGLILILDFLQKFVKADLTMFIVVNLFLIIFTMVPIPPLTGGKILFYSRNLYVFSLSLIILVFFLKGIGIIPTLILAVILSLLIMLAYYYYVDEEQAFIFPEFQQTKLFAQAEGVRRWKFILLFLILMLILLLAELNIFAVIALSLIGAFIIAVTYNVLQKRK